MSPLYFVVPFVLLSNAICIYNLSLLSNSWIREILCMYSLATSCCIKQSEVNIRSHVKFFGKPNATAISLWEILHCIRTSLF